MQRLQNVISLRLNIGVGRTFPTVGVKLHILLPRGNGK